MSENVAEKPAPTDKAVALAAYNDIVESADLTDIRLVDVKFNVKPQYYAVVHEELTSNKKIERSFDHVVSEISYNADSKRLGGRFDWSIVVSSSRKKLLKIEAAYFIAYHDVPDVGQEHIDAYFKKVGRFATYPYFRSLVSQLSWESKTELPIMPVLK